MVPPLKIAIIGCGTAGPAAALFLNRQGHQIDLFEKTPNPSPVGAGILLQPTGQAVLKKLNLLESIQKMGAPVTQLFGRTVTNRTIMDLDYRHLNPSWQGLGLHRGSLFQVLFDEVKKKDIKVYCGTEIQSFHDIGTKKNLQDTKGNTYGPYDLIIICDGARSALRHHSALVKKAKPYPWGALWVILEDPNKLFHQTLYQVYQSTTTMLGFLPTGYLPDNNRHLLSLFWSIKVDTVDEWKKQDINAWKERLAILEPRIIPLLPQIKSHDDLLFASYMDVVMKDWTDGINTIYLGDAAHAMSPQLGQGANVALMDAHILGKYLEQSNALPQALKQWSINRKSHIRYYQWASRWLTPFFQSSFPLLAPLRNTFMGPVCKIKPLRHIMLASMAGIKTGVFTEEKFNALSSLYFFNKSFIYDSRNKTRRTVNVQWTPIDNTDGMMYEKMDFGSPQKVRSLPERDPLYETSAISNEGEFTYRFEIIENWLLVRVIRDKIPGFRTYEITPQYIISMNGNEDHVEALHTILELCKNKSDWHERYLELEGYYLKAQEWARDPD